MFPIRHAAAAAATKSLQPCPTLCNPIDGSPPASPVPGILQARTLEWVAIAFSHHAPLPVFISPQMWLTCFPLDSRWFHSVVPIVFFVCNFFRSGYPVGFYLLRQAVLIMNFPSNHRSYISDLPFFCILLYLISLSTIINILHGTFYCILPINSWLWGKGCLLVVPKFPGCRRLQYLQ